MGFVFEEKPSSSPFVESIWRTEDDADGFYLAAAGGQWDLAFTKQGSKTTAKLSGPASHATPTQYHKGNSNFGIRFKPGVVLVNLPAWTMLNATTALPHATKHSFWFQSQSLALPTFDNADEFINSLARNNLLSYDPVIEAVLAGDQLRLSIRSVQRHFLFTTGLTYNYMHQIIRANQAVSMLQHGSTISDVALELGFADQAHMTRQVRVISGCTPGQIVQKVQTCRLSSIQGYGPCAQMKVQNFKGVQHGNQAL